MKMNKLVIHFLIVKRLSPSQPSHWKIHWSLRTAKTMMNECTSSLRPFQVQRLCNNSFDLVELISITWASAGCPQATTRPSHVVTAGLLAMG